MSEEQTKLIEDTEESASTTNKRQIAPEKRKITNEKIHEFLSQVLYTNTNIKEGQDAVAANVIEAIEKINMVADIAQGLSNRLDDLQNMTTDMVSEPVIEEKPQKEYISMQGTNGFREGPAPEPVTVAPESVATNMQEFVTTREIFNTYSKQISRRDGEFANKKLMRLMEKLCLMREDYSKLIKDMDRNINSFSAKDVLESFGAYLVDIENILSDADITIGHYGTDGDQVDVQHQRIVGVVNTADPNKNGQVAERLSEGYEYEGRAILKEKVNVYKVAEPAPPQTQTGFRLSPSQ